MCMVCDNQIRLKGGTPEEKAEAKDFFVSALVLALLQLITQDEKVASVFSLVSTELCPEDSGEILSRVADDLKDRLLATSQITRRIKAGDIQPPLPVAKGMH